MHDAADAATNELDIGAKLVVLLGGLLSALSLTAINSVLPLIDRALAHGPQDSMLVKQLIGGVGLTMVAGAAVSGFLVDRFGLKRVMIVSSFIYVVAGTAGLWVSSLPLLLVSRLVLGFVSACIQIASLTLINTQLDGPQRARWMGIHVSTAMFGTIAVHPIAGNLGELGWRYPFMLYAFGGVLLVGMIATRARPVKAGSGIATLARGAARSFAFPRWFPFHYIPLALLIGSIVFLPSVYLPFILRRFDTSPATTSYILTADSAAGAMMAMLYGAVRRRLGLHAAFAASLLVAAAGTLVAVLAPSLPWVICGMVIYGLGIGWLVPSLITGLGDKVEKARLGRATGFVKAAHFLAAPLAIVVMEPFSQVHGPASALGVVATISVVLLVMMLARGAMLRRRSAAA